MITRRLILAGVAALPLEVRFFSTLSRAQSSPQQFDYYISPSGSDSNAGTEMSPWAITSLQYGSRNYGLVGGKRIGLMDGTYNISTFPLSAYTAKLTIPSGTSSSPTVIQAVNTQRATIVSDPGATGFVGGGAIIGNGANGAGITSTPSYITIDGLVVTAGTTMPSEANVQSGIQFAGTSPGTCFGIVIQNCVVYNIVNYNDGAGNAPVNIGGIVLGGGPQGAVVRNCLVHDCYLGGGFPRSTHTNASGIHDLSRGLVLEYCTIHGCNNGIYQKNNASIPQGATLRNNYFYRGAGMNCALCGFNNAMGTTPPYAPLHVYNNVIENVNVLYDANDGVSGLQANANFYNNTVYHSNSVCLGSWIPTPAAVSAGVAVSLYNNILVSGTLNTSWGDLCLGPAAGDWAVCNYNCYPTGAEFGITTNQDTAPASLMSFSAWQALAGAPDINSILGAPGFVGSIVAGGGPGQYQLAANSICRNAGRVGGSSSGSAVDMGAWGDAGSVGCSFQKAPDPPSITGIS